MLISILFVVPLTGLLLAIAFARLWRRSLLRDSALENDLAALQGETARLARELDVSKSEYRKLEEYIKSASSLSEVERCQYEDKLREKRKEMQEKIDTLASLEKINADLLADNRELREQELEEGEMAREYARDMLGIEHKNPYE